MLLGFPLDYSLSLDLIETCKNLSEAISGRIYNIKYFSEIFSRSKRSVPFEAARSLLLAKKATIFIVQFAYDMIFHKKQLLVLGIIHF